MQKANLIHLYWYTLNVLEFQYKVILKIFKVLLEHDTGFFWTQKQGFIEHMDSQLYAPS